MTNGQWYGVTLDELMEMDACDTYSDDEFEHARELFAGRERLTLDDILALDISVTDKIWVMDRIVPRREMAKLQAVWVERVLPIFERECPNDKRPREAIEALKAWIADPTEENESALKTASAAAEKAARAVVRKSAAAWTVATTVATVATAAAEAWTAWTAWTAWMAAWAAAEAARTVVATADSNEILRDLLAIAAEEHAGD